MSEAGKGDSHTRVDPAKYWNAPYWEKLEARKNMTPKERIEEIEKKIRSLKEEINEIRRECDHEVVPSRPKDPECSHPVCSKCGMQWAG